MLHLSEHAAYGRIEAARAVRRFPPILERLRDGSVHLTAICLLAPHLTAENHAALLDAARHRSKRDVEQLVARLRPQPDAVPLVRMLPAPKLASSPQPVDKPGASATAPAAAPLLAPSRPRVIPLAPERYKVQVTVSKETHDKLRRAQDLLRHTIPSGDLALVIDRALTVLLQELEKAKAAVTERPRTARLAPPSSRHVPAAVRRAVWARDSGRCAFLGNAGRCTETGFLSGIRWRLSHLRRRRTRLRSD